MGALRALLIGVPGDLPTGLDTARLKNALLASGWDPANVTVADTAERTTAGGVYARLNLFLAGCADGDFGLVHFSGHGVRVNGVDHLVPSGYDPDAELEGLVGVRPDVLLKKLTSTATVMVCLDMCREDGGELDAAGAPLALTKARDNVVLVHGCAPGRPAWGNEEGGFLGRALAEAMGPESPPRTVEAVLAHVRRRTREMAGDHGVRAQVDVTWLGGTTQAPPPAHAGREIGRSAPGEEPWAKALHDAALWDRTDALDAATAGRARELLARLVERVVAVRRDAARPEKAGPDPWDDPRFPLRVLHQLDRLVPPPARCALSPLEVVTLLATPFVREAAVACGRRALAELYPAQGPGPEPAAGRNGAEPGTSPSAGARRHMADDMADVRAAFGQIEAKRLRLLAADDTASGPAAEQWLRHRLLDGWDELWDGWSEVPGGTPALPALHTLPAVLDQLTDAAALAVGLGPRPRSRARERLRTALLQVVAQMRTRPADTAPSGAPWEADLAGRLGLGRGTSWRPQALAELLHMAELLAVDPRSLDGIVVDHLGVRQHKVSPEALVEQVADSDFRPVGNDAEWTLDAQCRNAALHVALERRADTASVAARNIAKAHPHEPLHTALPRHINTDALDSDRDSAYESPPPRFQLAEDGVQPLIMGTQLYGDRMLAVRELYQNALDACRRRHARRRYAALTAPPGAEPPAVRALADHTVTLTLDRDPADGRLYIECADDGIGMTAEELRDLFARAGRRNEQSPARVRELRRWRRAGVVPELNSRFGIGVFSYFMLADEIRVTTRPAGPTGRGAAGQGHRVDVVADSGLMHITTDEDGEVGTRVRLYLRPEFGGEHSLIDFVNGNILYSPVRLVVREGVGRQGMLELPAGTLRLNGQRVPGADEPERDIWWVEGKGARLVDGIRVRGDKNPHGYVINLRPRHRPVLSASRNELNGFAEEVVLRELTEAVGDLTQGEAVSMVWLRKLVEDNARLAVAVIDRLVAEGTEVAVDQWPMGGPSRPATLRPLGALGCFPIDASFYTPFGLETSRLNQEFFLQWRSQMQWLEPPPGTGVPFPSGFPRPSGLDALLFNTEVTENWSPELAAIRAAAKAGLSVRETVRALRRYAVAGVRVPAVENIRLLAQVPSLPQIVGLCVAYAEAGYLPSMETGFALRTDPLRSVQHAPLLRQAAKSGSPLGLMTVLLWALRLLAPSLPVPVDPGELRGHTVSVAEGSLISPSVPRLPALPPRVTPTAAAYVAAKHGITSAEVIAVAARFARYGYEVTGGASPTDLSPDELALLDIRSYEAVPWLGTGPIDARRLIWLAARNTDDEGDVAATAAKATEMARRLGLTVRIDEAERAALFPLRAPSWWGWLPQDDDDRSRPPYSAWTILAAVSQDQDAPVDLLEVQALVDAGVAEAAAVDAVRTWLQRSPRKNLFRLSRGFERPYSSAKPKGNCRGPVELRESSNTVDTAFLVGAAAGSFGLAMTRDMLDSDAGTPEIRCAPIPEECGHLRPDRAVFAALCFTDTSVWRPEVTLGAVAVYAHAADLDLATAAANLRAYEPLGAPTVPGDAALDGEPFDDRNPAVEGLFRFEPLADGRLTPLTLTITAVRLGLGLRSAYDALAPYARFGLEIACPEPGDDGHAPDWRDVVILTRQLTGREPALGGEVEDGHVGLASEETDLTPAQVRERLGYYAPLFGLTLRERGEAAPGPPQEGSARGRA